MSAIRTLTITVLTLFLVFALSTIPLSAQNETEKGEILYWTCGMHPSVRSDESGQCPICFMALVPVYKKSDAGTISEGGEREIELVIGSEAARLARIKTVMVTRRMLSKTIRAAGEVSYDETRMDVIASRVGGRIEKLFADFTGKKFEKGDALALLYSPQLISAQKEYLLARNSDLESSAREKLLLWGITESQVLELERRGKIQTYLSIHAPIGGTIVHKYATEGSYVKEGDVLFHMADLSRVWVLADVFENDLGSVSPNQKTTVESEVYPGENFEGKIAFIDPFVDRKTRSAKVRMEFDNPEHKLLPGMFVSVEIKSPLHTPAGVGVLAVPRSAVINTGTRTIAFVEIEKGRYTLRKITIGPMAEGHYVVIEGLSEGEHVVERGSFLLDSQTQLTGGAEEIYGGALGKESQEERSHQHRH